MNSLLIVPLPSPKGKVVRVMSERAFKCSRTFRLVAKAECAIRLRSLPGTSEDMHNALRSVMARPRAVHCATYLANSGAGQWVDAHEETQGTARYRNLSEKLHKPCALAGFLRGKFGRLPAVTERIARAGGILEILGLDHLRIDKVPAPPVALFGRY